jgi:hypothetical protein
MLLIISYKTLKNNPSHTLMQHDAQLSSMNITLDFAVCFYSSSSGGGGFCLMKCIIDTLLGLMCCRPTPSNLCKNFFMSKDDLVAYLNS